MKTLIAAVLLPGSLASGLAATTINPAHPHAYGANIGWMDWRGDTNSGAVIGEYVCSGYVYAADVGWIHLGGGAPTNGIQYQNISASDFGVNHDGRGNLRGLAYGADIGWLNFETIGAPAVDLKTGRLSGSIYSANCGWISLSNAFAFVQTDLIAPGVDTDGDGMADAWERQQFGNLTTANASTDTDHDGQSDLQEYLADTNPNDSNDNLRITQQDFSPGGTTAMLTWRSTPTRCYFIQKTPDLTTTLWLDGGLGIISPDGASTSRAFADTNAPMRFYRVQAVKPLAP